MGFVKQKAFLGNHAHFHCLVGSISEKTDLVSFLKFKFIFNSYRYIRIVCIATHSGIRYFQVFRRWRSGGL
jgi:hypothetical protein